METVADKKPSKTIILGSQGSGYLLFAKINYSFPLRVGSDLVPIDCLDTGVLPAVDIKQIETLVTMDSSCSYWQYQLPVCEISLRGSRNTSCEQYITTCRWYCRFHTQNCDHFTYTYVGWFYGQCVGEQHNEKPPQK